MSTLGLIGFGLLLLAAASWSLYEFAVNTQRFIAPDNADRDEINAEHGEGTPEALAALEQRFGPGDHWRDAATGIGGLIGILALLWVWFD